MIRIFLLALGLVLAGPICGGVVATLAHGAPHRPHARSPRIPEPNQVTGLHGYYDPYGQVFRLYWDWTPNADGYLIYVAVGVDENGLDVWSPVREANESQDGFDRDAPFYATVTLPGQWTFHVTAFNSGGEGLPSTSITLP